MIWLASPSRMSVSSCSITDNITSMIPTPTNSMEDLAILLMSMFIAFFHAEKIYKAKRKMLVMKLAYIIPIIVVILMVALTGTGIHQINRALALAGIAVVGITFIVGPLPKYNKWFNKLKVHRRYLGVSGFLILLLHSIISMDLFFGWEIGEKFNPENFYFISAQFSTVAFLILLALTLTSTNYAMRLLGPNWKKLQTFGYVGFAASIVHFYLSQSGALNLVESLVFIFVMIVIIVRIISMRK